MPNYKLMTGAHYSHKMELGLASGVGQAVLYLAPASEAGRGVNLCSGHSPECFANCLIHSGQMAMPHAHTARVRKTQLLLNDPVEFGRLLDWDLQAHLRWCERNGYAPAFRFNGTSDYPWETWPVPHLGQTVHQRLLEIGPMAMVNEYTKRYSIMKRYLEGAYPPNLYMTFSLHELNEGQARDVLARGGNVTVVFRVNKGQPLPSVWFDRPVLDGDVDDLRWLDNARARTLGLNPGRGLVIGLRYKRASGRDKPTAFVQEPNVTRLTLPLLRAA